MTRIAVFGATGHTGRFVVDEIERRGLIPLRIGRDARKLAASDAAGREPGRIASIDDPRSLDAAIAGAGAVINCAGPFLDTAHAVIDAALRAGIPYLDLSAEQAAVQSILRDYRDAPVPIVPAAAFFGGLADLLATAAADGEPYVDAIDIAVGLDSWHPTEGTRLTGRRNTAPRVVQRGGKLEQVPVPPPTARWDFSDPIGPREVLMLPFSETIAIRSHLQARDIMSWINVEPIRDLRDPATPPPEAIDEHGRSAQSFSVDVVVTGKGRRRRATALGRDIYAVTAPIVVEAAQRLLAGEGRGGVHSLGAMFDALSFLAALAEDAVQITLADLSAHPLQRTPIDA
ncbi:saccharopine dehydrogenase NADP-binding domain-containing protein [Sphingomonas tabacisoli]|uniref:Saccharopine dehydrogenase NADP-binding domain-containing protein n=1 Tax=Sphingomonas tabacisoli TaxID=2249466 RepID=A0ABW4I4N5_9SPHN